MRAASDASRSGWPGPGVRPLEQGYRLSDAQAQAILELHLRRPDRPRAGQDRQRIQGRHGQDVDLLNILAKPERITEIIVGELTAIRDQFGDERVGNRPSRAGSWASRTSLPRQDMVVTLSHGGCIQGSAARRLPRPAPRRPRQAGGGDQGPAGFCRSPVRRQHARLRPVFSNRGRCYWLKVTRRRRAAATAAASRSSIFPLEEGERGHAGQGVLRRPVCVHGHRHGHGQEDAALRFSNPRKAGVIIAVALDEGDYLIVD